MVAAAVAAAPVDRSALAARIQGFGNINPPALEEETAKSVAKRAMGRLQDLAGEEVALTVEDFREKGAVGAVKDAVLDAGDLLIDGVSAAFGWLRGDPPPEEDDSEAAEDATRALSNGPQGAAYGVSQASPTGGINAVWVMPEEADPAMIQELVRNQTGPNAGAPANIQPYMPQAPMAIPGGPVIAPYQPAGRSVPGGPAIAPYVPPPARGAGAAARPPAFIPGVSGGFPQGTAGGFQPGFGFPGAAAAPPGAGAGAGPTGAKGLVEQIARGGVTAGPDAARRLVSQCAATQVTAKRLADIVCERARRLYLGLDGDSGAGGADAALARLLALTDALAQQPGELPGAAAKAIAAGVSEELLSLQSSAQHRDAAAPRLRRIGLVKEAPPEPVDLLGCEAAAAPGGAAGPLGGAPLIDVGGPAAPVAAAAPQGDLLW